MKIRIRVKNKNKVAAVVASSADTTISPASTGMSTESPFAEDY